MVIRINLNRITENSDEILSVLVICVVQLPYCRGWHARVGREISQRRKREETKDAAGSGSIPEETLLNIYLRGVGGVGGGGETR